MVPAEFGHVDAVNITILVDNRADLIVKSDDRVKYFTDKALLAEHGYSALVHFPGDIPDDTSGEDLIGKPNILWDAGVTRIALMENLRRMEIDPHSVRAIALSHGHHDHYAALSEFLTAMNLGFEPKEWTEPITAEKVAALKNANRVPVIAHPAAFRERWWKKEDGTMVGPLGSPPRMEWEALGAVIRPSEAPYPLRPGCWTTGYVPRNSFEQSGRPARLYYRQGDHFNRDDLEEDQAIVINIRDKGLVILSGCAHAGIVNTVNYAREISGVDRVFAVIGGFHLARSTPEEIQSTIDAFKPLRPVLLVPSHCTGFKAMCAFSQQMSSQFVPGVVGATYQFS
jgi:7,8-dihydropterin-6-yl-methyl-4-(beta-D-ribofuranosyl)aminobenzene 5'-phosphate synthase